MNMNRILQNLCTLAASLLMLAACTQDKLSDPSQGEPLPEGKYPMTFSTAVDGLTMTRAATADGLWSADDKIAVQVGSSVKQYTPTNISGNIATLSSTSPFYWQSTADISVSAWYYGTGYSDIPPDGTSWAVQSDQSGDGYQKSDFLYTPARSIAFKPAAGTDNGLTFYHQTARVVVNIVNADAATDGNTIEKVVIGHNNNLALKGVYSAPTTETTAGAWTPATTASDMGTIISKKQTAGKLADGTTTALASYAALVIPQNMSGKKFIAVTLSNDNTYYYTPKNNDGDLQAGVQHTYDITVKNGYLEVVAATGGTWGGGSSEAVVSDIIYPYTALDLKPGDYYYSDGTTSDGGLRTLYADGTTKCEDIGPFSDKTCIGVVFWVGDATAKDKTLKADHESCTHGLVVALKDASGDAWQSSYASVQTWLNSNQSGVFLPVASNFDADAPLNNIQGYNNTKAIEAFNAYNSGYVVQAVQKVVAYRNEVSAPATSSGWYLPSEKELTLLCGKDVTDIKNNLCGGTGNCVLINKQLVKLKAYVIQTVFPICYWSSTELNNTLAFSVYFGSGGNVGNRYKDGTDRVRGVLAF